MDKTKKIIVTGAAGLLGQNLILMLHEKGYTNIIAIDKNKKNLAILKRLNNAITTIEADLSKDGNWADAFENTDTVLMLHAQITGLYREEFINNNIVATEKVLGQIKKSNISYTVHISSSVVNSVAKDYYTDTKKEQETLVLKSKIPCCILRPTLMFGWFDPKHLGWLSRFMERAPVFPVPGNGKYLRQPLYSRDFCRVIIAAMEKQRVGETFDIVGQEEINYIDIIRSIKRIKHLKTCIIKIPYHLFYCLLKCYAVFNKKPPFTADQLTSLTAGDYFTGVDYEKCFNIKATPLNQAFEETYTHPEYSQIILERCE
jgi:nucleoside-diphosphate-sugar epimerase